MPTIKQLEAFRDSFETIGGEAVILAEQRKKPGYLELPDNDPVSNPFEERSVPRPGGQIPNWDDLENAAVEREPLSEEFEVYDPDASPDLSYDDGFDFSAFLDNIPGEISEPAIEDIPGPEPSLEDASFSDAPFAETPAADTEDLSFPDELLNGLADDLASGENAAEDVPAPEGFDSSGFDLDLDSLGLDEEPARDDVPEIPEIITEQPSDMISLFSEVPPEIDPASVEDTPPGEAALSREGVFEDISEKTPSETGDFDFSIPDFDIPDLDIPDFDDEGAAVDAVAMGAAGEESGSEDTEPASGDFGDEILGDEFLPDINLDELLAEGASGGTEAAGKIPAGEIPGEEGIPDFSIPDFEVPGDFSRGIDLGEEDAPGGSPGGEAVPPVSGDEFSIPELESAPEAAAGPDMDESEISLDLGGEFSETPDDTVPAGDSFDNFNLDGGDSDFSISGADISLDESTFGIPGDEFSLAGIDDIFTDGAKAKSSLGKALGSGKTQGAADEDIEEIRLNAADMEKLEKTLASYPLNLRIACEEIIAEQVVAPELMSSLIKKLTGGASPREAASLAGKILDRPIPIPKGFEKKTGEALEEEQSSFAYVFVHNFLPVLRVFFACALVALSLFYLIYKFVYTPLRADGIYERGYERIGAGEFSRANENFGEALRLHKSKKWFFRYAEAFRDARQFLYAEEKYDELLRYYPRDKQGALDYAALETSYLHNYEKADRVLRNHILDYTPDDREGLLAQGDNNLVWGDGDASRYEEARRGYAKLIERYGERDEYMERMMKYFIRTDRLGEVIPLQKRFMESKKTKISASALSELGGYLLDKRFEETKGVPDANISRIEGLRDLLLRAVAADPSYPESHYHLFRYYQYFGSAGEQRRTLSNAISAFDQAPELSPRRISYRIEAQRQYAWLLTSSGEFFPAEEELVKGIEIYEDALRREVLSRSPAFGRLYADMGDLEYFKKDGNMDMTLRHYHESEANGWLPPEIRYRMGSAYYHERDWAPALEYFFKASADMPLNRRLLYALGNASYMRGDYYAAEGYYNRLLDMLEVERFRFPLLQPQERPDHMELAERIMVSRNNLGVTLEALADRSGNPGRRSLALSLYAESARAWDALTRNPATMVRMSAGDLSGPGINQAYLNSRNALHPAPDYEPEIYTQIDKDVLEPSIWERLAPPEFGLSGDIPFQVRPEE